MKNLLLLLLFVSCSKATYKQIPSNKGPKTYASALSFDSKAYSQNIDLAVAFLWPERVVTDEQRLELQFIISTSRKLKLAKEQFQEKRYELKVEYQRLDCPCILEFRCTGNETRSDEVVCLELEDSIFENDKLLPGIYQLVDIMKEKVIGIGGEWIQTNFEFPEAPVSTFNFNTLELNLNVFGASENLPLDYQFPKPEIFQDKDFQLLTFSSPRKLSVGSWRIEVAPYKTKASLLFQGEFFWEHSGKKRRGFIIWEHAKSL
jgi:hypothetical protein